MKSLVWFAASALTGCAGSDFADEYDRRLGSTPEAGIHGAWTSKMHWPSIDCILQPAPGGDVAARFLVDNSGWAPAEHEMLLVCDAPDRWTGKSEFAAVVILTNPGERPSLSILFHFGERAGDDELIRSTFPLARPNALEDGLFLASLPVVVPYVFFLLFIGAGPF